MAKAVRMSDIAKRLHVSTVTVSKALAGKDGVSEDLRKKIQTLAVEMGYQSQKNKEENVNRYTIGIITSYRYIEKGQSFYWALYERSLFHLSQNGHTGILEVITEEAEEKLWIPRLIQDQRIDGLIVMGNFSFEYYKMLEQTKVPFLILDAFHAELQQDCVISDGYYGMYIMTKYLIGVGHREIQFVGSIDQTSSILDRYYGYCRAMREAGISVMAEQVLPDRDVEGKIFVSLENLKRMPTAFACNCDITAYTLMKQLQALGVSIPDDVSLVGFDDFIFSDLANPPITTYAVDINLMSKRSVRQLLCRIKNPNSPIRHIVVSGTMIERKSVRFITEK
ncbi:MAG: LacI family DNA-binding transcriptional regulator [Oscillospiraceae bacterium]|nr:LacI family DNA-binding transcriptional regulator [Oscillospiraceae bacterium]